MSNIDYLFCKGVIDLLLSKNLITIKEHKEIDALNRKKLTCLNSLIFLENSLDFDKNLR